MRRLRNEAPAAWGAHLRLLRVAPPAMRTLGLRRGGRAALRAALSLAGRPLRASTRADVSRETSAAPPRGWPAAAPLSLCRPDPFQLRRYQPTLRQRHASSRPPLRLRPGPPPCCAGGPPQRPHFPASPASGRGFARRASGHGPAPPAGRTPRAGAHTRVSRETRVPPPPLPAFDRRQHPPHFPAAPSAQPPPHFPAAPKKKRPAARVN